MGYTRTYVGRLPSVSPTVFANACCADPVLKSWIRSEFLDPRPLRQAASLRRNPRWIVVDRFFKEDRLERLVQCFSKLSFAPDDVGLNYHSTAVRVDTGPRDEALELLLNPMWHAYVAFVLGARLRDPGRTVVKYRKHPPWSRGFWIHTDRDNQKSKSLAVLAYLNRAWGSCNGGLLQLWRASLLKGTPQSLKRWQAYQGKRLSFLEGQKELNVEVAGEGGLVPLKVRLVEEIVPLYNRIVFLNFVSSPAFHAVTPSYYRCRKGILQWLY